MVVEVLQQLVNNSKSDPIQLAQCHLDAIENIRKKLCNAPIFPYPHPKYTFILDCDASSTAIGCELLQIVDGKERVIAFGSYSLTPAQRRYCTMRKELLLFALHGNFVIICWAAISLFLPTVIDSHGSWVLRTLKVS